MHERDDEREEVGAGVHLLVLQEGGSVTWAWFFVQAWAMAAIFLTAWFVTRLHRNDHRDGYVRGYRDAELGLPPLDFEDAS